MKRKRKKPTNVSEIQNRNCPLLHCPHLSQYQPLLIITHKYKLHVPSCLYFHFYCFGAGICNILPGPI